MGLQTFIKDAYQKFSAELLERRLKRRLKDQVLSDIKMFINKNCSRMSLNAGFRKKLIQSINYSLTHISRLIDQIPGPIELDPRQWEEQPVLHSIFLNPEDISTRLKSSNDLKNIFKIAGTTEVIALLTATLNKKTVLGIEKTGEILRRDVPQETIYFDDHQIVAPSRKVSESKFKVNHLAMNSLCSQIYKETSEMQTWKKELQEQQALLEFKQGSKMPSDSQSEAKEIKQLLSDIKSKIATIDSQINTTDEHLDRITRIFDKPENNLTLIIEKLKLDKLGTRLDAASTERADEFSIAVFQFGQTTKKAALWVRIKREFLT